MESNLMKEREDEARTELLHREKDETARKANRSSKTEKYKILERLDTEICRTRQEEEDKQIRAEQEIYLSSKGTRF